MVTAGAPPPGLVRPPVYSVARDGLELVTDGQALWLAGPRCPDANGPPGCADD